jgi:hypothetical protein
VPIRAEVFTLGILVTHTATMWPSIGFCVSVISTSERRSHKPATPEGLSKNRQLFSFYNRPYWVWGEIKFISSIRQSMCVPVFQRWWIKDPSVAQFCEVSLEGEVLTARTRDLPALCAVDTLQHTAVSSLPFPSAVLTSRSRDRYLPEQPPSLLWASDSGSLRSRTLLVSDRPGSSTGPNGSETEQCLPREGGPRSASSRWLLSG